MPQKRSDPLPGQMPLEDLFTIEKFAAMQPDYMTVQTIRWQLRHREQNGLESACVRMGRRLLISKSRYEAWLASRGSLRADAAA